MSVQSLLDRLEARVGTGWERSTGNQSLIKIIEIGQDQLVEEVYDKRVWIDPGNDGYPPHLKTVAGTNSYDIIAANLNGVTSIVKNINGSDIEVVPELATKIFIDVTSSSAYSQMPYAIEHYDINPFSSDLTRIRIALIPVRVEPALENTPARVIFPFDPGTSDEKYYCEFLWQPPRLISEYIPLIVPLKFELALEEFVVGYCQEFEHGGLSDYIVTFFSQKRSNGESWTDRYKNYMHRGAPHLPSRVNPRVC
jgi:hypothetical protein